MKYRSDKYGNRISALGYGCMRFPQMLGKINMDETEKLILSAVDAGINYFDTAYIYPGSEAALGAVLEKHKLRDKVLIATKLPYYLIRNMEKLEKLFQEQLNRLRTDHVDYYLMHMLSDIGTWGRLLDMGILSWLEEKRKLGSIRQVGFSYHGNSDMFCKLLDVYDWDFCQIQYNYMDEHSQAGRKGLDRAHEKGIPVIIMEPLRGGKLAGGLPADGKRIISGFTPERTPAEWALRWLWDQKEVTCVLSGMSTTDMLAENIRTASQTVPGEMTDREREMLQKVVQAVNAKIKVGCTGCGYCMPCPKNVDIPGTFAAYNRRYAEGKFYGLKDYAMCTAFRRTSTAASNCIGCGKCENHCPQQISIRDELAKASKELEGPLYKTFRWFISKQKTF